MDWWDAILGTTEEVAGGAGGAVADVAAPSVDYGSALADVARTATPVSDVLRDPSLVSLYTPGGTVAAPTAVPDVADASGGLSDIAKSALRTSGDVAKGALPYASLGLAGVGIAGGIESAKSLADTSKTTKKSTKTQERLSSEAEAAAAPLTSFGTSALEKGKAGTISTADQQKIDNWAKGAKEKVRSYLAGAGLSDSSTLVDWENWIDQQKADFESSAALGEEDVGIKALSAGGDILATAASTSSGAAKTATSSSKTLTDLINDANKTLASLEATSS